MAYDPLVKNSISTTDATVTTILTIPVTANTILSIEGLINARRTGGSSGASNDGASYHVSVSANNTSGTAAIIGNNIQSIGESQSSWDVTCTVSSGNVLIQVTGAANNNISWDAEVKTIIKL